MVHIKTDTSIEAMRDSGRVVAQILTRAREVAAVGVTPRELDEAAREVLREAGASSPFLDYKPHFAPTPFPAVICVSVNDAVVHGIPSAEPLRDGDLVSVDAGALLGGWAGDAAVSFTVGAARPADTRLIATAEAALQAGIGAAVVGNRIGDIAHAIGTACRAAGYGILDGYGGHGIGRGGGGWTGAVVPGPGAGPGGGPPPATSPRGVGYSSATTTPATGTSWPSWR
ncbi:M24 family metallopeptidase, partial [Streptomyces bacillaris]